MIMLVPSYETNTHSSIRQATIARSLYYGAKATYLSLGLLTV